MNDGDSRAREALHEWAATYNDQALLAEGLEAAFLGMAIRAGNNEPLAIYDIEKCIEILMQRDGMTYDGALDFLNFNTFDAWLGPGTPLFLWRYDHEGA